jgi:hypothetical protein
VLGGPGSQLLAKIVNPNRGTLVPNFAKPDPVNWVPINWPVLVVPGYLDWGNRFFLKKICSKTSIYIIKITLPIYLNLMD